ncbi:MAG TPA: tetratricopeptide repeat protein [Patescibacteria group bacterium]
MDNNEEVSFKNLFFPFTNLKAFFLFFIIGIFVYFNSLFNQFVWDDELQIVRNPHIHSLSNIPILFTRSVSVNGPYYKPVMMTIYSIIYFLFGYNTFFYHFLQLLLHITSAFLVFVILKKYIKAVIALFCSLIFLIHPINTEAVAYIASLQETLFFFFGILSLYLIQKYQPKFIIYLLSFFLLLLSLLSKETGICFVILVVIFGAIFTKSKFKFLIFGISTVASYSFMRYGVAHVFSANTKIQLIPISGLSLSQRILNIPEIIFYYIRTFIYPESLAINQQWVVTRLDVPNFYLPFILDLLFFSILIIGGLYLYIIKNKFKTYLFFFLWFVIGLGLHLQIIPLDMTVADRWFYFPMVGLLGMIGLLIQSLNFKRKYIFLAIGILILIIFSIRSIVRNADWHDKISLYTHDLKIYDSSEIESNLAVEYVSIKDYQNSLIHFRKSVALYPTELNLSNLGYYYDLFGKYDIAESYYKKALLLNKYPYAQHKVIILSVYRRLILVYLHLNKIEDAETLLKNKISNFSNDKYLWEYLSIAEYKRYHIKEASIDIQKAIQLGGGSESKKIYEEINNSNEIVLPPPQ